MVSKIIFLILFEIIIFTNGNPAYRQNYNNEEPLFNLKTLIEELSKQAKYDVTLGHHEDQPGKHHEDITKISYNRGIPKDRYYNEKYRSAYPFQSAAEKNLYYTYHPKQIAIENMNVYHGKKLLKSAETKKDETKQISRDDDKVMKFLNEIDEKVNGHNELQLRCIGDRCGASRAEDSKKGKDDYFYANRNYNQNSKYGHLRCNGNRCSIVVDDDRNDRACYGNRCSRKAFVDNVYEDIDISKVLRNRDDDNDARVALDNLRCVGNQCGRNKAVDDDDDDDDERAVLDSLRCVGNQCGGNRAVDDGDDNDRAVLDSLRCVGNRCGANRAADDDNDDDRAVLDSLRCVGNRCGANRAVDDDDDRAVLDSLRCVGNRCGANRAVDDDDDDRAVLDSLRCVGNRCGANRAADDDDDDDDRAVLDSLRCVGNRCGAKRAVDDDDDDVDDRAVLDSLRCVGNRCGANRATDDDDDNTRAALDSLRCVGNRCGANRAVDDDDDDDDMYALRTLRCNGRSCNIIPNDEYPSEHLRCNGKSCNNRNDDSDTHILRCIGDFCSRISVVDDDSIYIARCAGKSCSVNRLDKDNDDKHDESNYRSYANLNRNDDRYNRNDDNDDDDKGNPLRCFGKQCSRTRYFDEIDSAQHKYPRNPDAIKAIVENLLKISPKF